MKTLIITGGNDGIGYHMTRQWLEDGNCAAVLDLHCEHIDELKTHFPDTLLTFSCDVRDAAALKTVVEHTNAHFGEISYAVHNACVCLFKSFEEHDMDDYNQVMDVNFHGAVNLVKATLPVMQKQGHGSICLTSSGVGVTGYFNISSYACSKGAIESLAKCLRIEYADTGVTFHIIHPPLTNTQSSSPLPIPKEFKADPEKVGRGLVKNIDSRKFILTPSFGDAVSVWLSYLFPLKMGGLLTRMTKRAEKG